MSLKEYIQAAPKAELHVHLEGSIRPETLLSLARRNHVALPVETLAEMQDWFRYRDFTHFMEIYIAVSRCLKTAADYEQITYEFGADMARQHIRYAEVTFSPCTHRFSLHVPQEVFFTGLTRGRERAHKDFGVEIAWVFDIVRNGTQGASNTESADYTLAIAREGMSAGVIALGLGGGEVGYPPELFTKWFEQARADGLHSAPHAGELVGPASIWGAIRCLGAERIGHGVRAIEDPDLVTYLREKQLPLEVCPSSNLRLGVYPSLESHPLAQLYRAGVPLTVNTDDPPLFNTTLNDEFELLPQIFPGELETINTLLLNGIRQSFLPSDRKAALLADFQTELARLQKQYLLEE